MIAATPGAFNSPTTVCGGSLMFRLLIPAVAAALLFVTAEPAQAQFTYTAPGQGYPGSQPGPSASFYWYGVPNAGLHRTLGSGTSYYPYYYFGGYRSTLPAPLSGSNWDGDGSSPRAWGGRRGWRR
jgi:hypothetical protein